MANVKTQPDERRSVAKLYDKLRLRRIEYRTVAGRQRKMAVANETSALEGPGPGDERVLYRFSEPNLDKVAIDSQLCRRQDGKGIVLKAGPAEDPSLQVRGPPYDVEGLSDERPDGTAAPVTVAEGAVDGPAGRTGGADRGRMGRMGQGVEG
ncbi:hypothetical protein LAZ67_1007104 [Cordylochernes scorpioides]|uniref:Uncharacterized protein n=1 Tax=Cordylochernes scorpioides TaxID=51811 RepID=A0ABY6K0W8_9ARAC|nr:hypothetical protein LAZ67_1007104 [Cordylochernes scorpioides]